MWGFWVRDLNLYGYIVFLYQVCGKAYNLNCLSVTPGKILFSCCIEGGAEKRGLFISKSEELFVQDFKNL